MANVFLLAALSCALFNIGVLILVIDNWRRWVDSELMLHREVAELETALSQLQRAVGLQFVQAEFSPETPGQGQQP